ncbi:hypothetical protein AB3R30_12160 [Leptolyngbyaceae cyanobacterium UHCC 1019]
MRTLEGVEAEFYLEAMQLALDELQQYSEAEVELNLCTYDRIFDSASFEQKVFLLHRALTPLLVPTVEAPALTNTLEAAAYFPFAYVRMQIVEEIECEEFEADEEPKPFTYAYRELVWQPFSAYLLEGWQESEFEDEGDEYEPIIHHVHSIDLKMWKDIIEGLMNRIFWDRDWQITAINPQLLDGIDPNLGEAVGLTDAYLTNRLPKVDPEQASELLAEI